jgi:hypothetical protein
MANVWPWIAVAGLGALHGLSPTSGWMFAAACGVRAHDGTQVRRALLPIAIGQVASVAVVAYAMTEGWQFDRSLVQFVAGALLIGAALHRRLRAAGHGAPARTQARHAGLALWSFLMAGAQGVGMMLVPALVPLCLANSPAREITATGSLVLALAAVAVHMAAMLATTGVVAAGACRVVTRHARRLSGKGPAEAWTVVLAITGAVLIALR